MQDDTLSHKIRQCVAGVVNNPYQGDDKRVVFVCTMGILRSATGARIYGTKYNTRSAGTHPEALIRLNENLLNWADKIVFVNAENYRAAAKEYDLSNYDVTVLDIPDTHPHMHPEIVKAFHDQYEPLNVQETQNG